MLDSFRFLLDGRIVMVVSLLLLFYTIQAVEENFASVVNWKLVFVTGPAVLYIVLFFFGGPDSIWELSTPWVAGITFATMWFAVMFIAFLDKEFGFQNLGFFGGILLLNGVIVYLHPHIQQLPANHWAREDWIVWGGLILSSVGVIWFENFTKWTKPDSHLQAADWWYLAMAPVFFFWIGHALLAGGAQLFRSGNWFETTATWIVGALVVAAAISLILQLSGVGGTRKWGLNLFGGSILIGGAAHEATLHALRAASGFVSAVEPLRILNALGL